MPARFIASKSAVIPALVTLPLFQNQYTHGRAEAGGLANSDERSRASNDMEQSDNTNAKNNFVFIDLKPQPQLLDFFRNMPHADRKLHGIRSLKKPAG
jgi:hypothetical protein